MCGRASLPNDVSELKQDLRIEWDKLGDYKPRWNAAPTSDLPVVTSSSSGRTLELMRWGLIPSWAKEWAKEWAKNSKISRSTFNARQEGIDTKPAFRGAWKAGRRCLVVADGYYEWRQTDRQPFAMALGNRGLMTFAGLWDLWRAPARRHHPRSHAGDPAARLLAGMAWRNRRNASSAESHAATLSVGGHGAMAGRQARRQCAQ